jgi:hypothetical protein
MQTLDYLQEVRQGNPALLAGLFEKALASQQVRVGGRREVEELHLLFESKQALDPEVVCTYVCSAFQALNFPPRLVHLYGRSRGEDIPSWQRCLQWPTGEMSPDPIDSPITPASGFKGQPEIDPAAAAPAAEAAGALMTLSHFEPDDQLPSLASEAPVSSRSRQRFPLWAGLLLGVGLVAVGGYWAWRQRTGMESAAAPIPTVGSKNTPTPVASAAKQFQQARLAGWQAALAAQKAKTYEEWGQVVQLWQTAIAQMTAIPAQTPEGRAAQAKIREYQQNRAIALRRQRLATSAQ